MHNWKRCKPGVSPANTTVSPGATIPDIPGGGRHAAAGIKGVFPGTPTPLRGGMNPPPNAITSVKVWFLPPLFETRTFCPSLMLMYDGSFRHDGWPTVL